MAKVFGFVLGFMALFVLVVAFTLGLSFLVAWVFMWAWNYGAVYVFPSLPVLDYWRSVAVYFLILLIGGSVRAITLSK